MFVAVCPAMDLWKRFHNDFKALMEEEDRIVRQRELRDRFHVDVIYEESEEFGSWSFSSSATESLQARFELLAAEAGIALGSPSGTSPHVYWLHRLFVDLRANNSQHIRIYNEGGGIIERLFEASATYCARLNRQSLENAVSVRERSETRNEVATKVAANRGDGAELSEAESRTPPQRGADRAEPGTPPSPKRGPKPDYETAGRVAEIVARVAGEDQWRSKLDDICLELDESTIPRPKTWKARGHGDWFDALSERHLVEKAIAHHLELAARHRETFS